LARAPGIGTMAACTRRNSNARSAHALCVLLNIVLRPTNRRSLCASSGSAFLLPHNVSCWVVQFPFSSYTAQTVDVVGGHTIRFWSVINRPIREDCEFPLSVYQAGPAPLAGSGVHQ
jgi:hypothetical protein